MHHHNSPHCNPNNKPQKWQPQAQLTDCISANELLQALNTLQQIQTSITPIDGECKENFELSFSQSSYGLFNTGAYATDGNHCMDFQAYMGLKKQKNSGGTLKDKNKEKGDKNKDKSARPNKYGHQEANIKKVEPSYKRKNNDQMDASITSTHDMNPRKSVTPKKYPTNVSISPNNRKIAYLRSRSHSPQLQYEHQNQPKQRTTINNPQVRSTRKARNSVTPTKGIGLSTSVVLAFGAKVTTTRTDNCMGQNARLRGGKKIKNSEDMHEQACQDNATHTKISDNSKKIIQELQKKGKTYIPIQQRTNQLIKQKQQKIAKLQRACLAQKQIQQREYTFKPSINNYKKSMNREKQNRERDPIMTATVTNRHRSHTMGNEITSYSNADSGNVLGQITNLTNSKAKQASKTGTDSNVVTSMNMSISTIGRKQKEQKERNRRNGTKCDIILDLIN